MPPTLPSIPPPPLTVSERHTLSDDSEIYEDIDRNWFAERAASRSATVALETQVAVAADAADSVQVIKGRGVI